MLRATGRRNSTLGTFIVLQQVRVIKKNGYQVALGDVGSTAHHEFDAEAEEEGGRGGRGGRRRVLILDTTGVSAWNLPVSAFDIAYAQAGVGVGRRRQEVPEEKERLHDV
jgi:hypothetical protein